MRLIQKTGERIRKYDFYPTFSIPEKPSFLFNLLKSPRFAFFAWNTWEVLCRPQKWHGPSLSEGGIFFSYEFPPSLNRLIPTNGRGANFVRAFLTMDTISGARRLKVLFPYFPPYRTDFERKCCTPSFCSACVFVCELIVSSLGNFSCCNEDI